MKKIIIFITLISLFVLNVFAWDFDINDYNHSVPIAGVDIREVSSFIPLEPGDYNIRITNPDSYETTLIFYDEFEIRVNSITRYASDSNDFVFNITDEQKYMTIHYSNNNFNGVLSNIEIIKLEEDSLNLLEMLISSMTMTEFLLFSIFLLLFISTIFRIILRGF